MRQILNKIKYMRNKVSIAITMFMTAWILGTNRVFAAGETGNIKDWNFWKGLQNLLDDTMTALLILAPSVAIIALGVVNIMKMKADEQDVKGLSKRRDNIIASCVGTFVVSGFIKIVISYFK